jgi:hypothetical protein
VGRAQRIASVAGGPALAGEGLTLELAHALRERHRADVRGRGRELVTDGCGGAQVVAGERVLELRE